MKLAPWQVEYNGQIYHVNWISFMAAQGYNPDGTSK